MTHQAAAISPARFAEALRDLPLSTLHLKAAELRNSIAHLDYSNEQLKPFADGSDASTSGQPDQDCVEAIKENEIVIERMQERITLLRAEVESRGSSWLEFQSADEVKEEEQNGESLSNGTTDTEAGQERSEAWRDGTFQTGRIVNGEVTMNGDARVNGVTNGTTSSNTGGSLDDDALRRAVDERMRALAEEGDDEGMHL